MPNQFNTPRLDCHLLSVAIVLIFFAHAIALPLPKDQRFIQPTSLLKIFYCPPAHLALFICVLCPDKTEGAGGHTTNLLALRFEGVRVALPIYD